MDIIKFEPTVLVLYAICQYIFGTSDSALEPRPVKPVLNNLTHTHTHTQTHTHTVKQRLPTKGKRKRMK